MKEEKQVPIGWSTLSRGTGEMEFEKKKNSSLEIEDILKI